MQNDRQLIKSNALVDLDVRRVICSFFYSFVYLLLISFVFDSSNFGLQDDKLETVKNN